MPDTTPPINSKRITYEFPRAEAHFTLPITVEYRDLDTNNHVNHATYLTYVESARLKFYRQLSGRTFNGQDNDIIIAEITCSYRAQAVYEDRLAIGLKVSNLSRKSFIFGFTIWRGDSDEVIACGRSVQVFFDYKTNIPKDTPVSFRHKVAELEEQLRKRSGREKE